MILVCPNVLKGSGWVGKKKAERGQGHGVTPAALIVRMVQET